MKLADQIKDRLIRYVASSPMEIVLPNFYLGMYEADVLNIKLSGYAI